MEDSNLKLIKNDRNRKCRVLPAWHGSLNADHFWFWRLKACLQVHSPVTLNQKLPDEDSPDLPSVKILWPYILNKLPQVSFQNIPYWVCHTIFIFFFSLNVKSLYGFFNPKNGQSTCDKTLSTREKNDLGIPCRERILFTFSITFLIGNDPGRYILFCSWNITACRIYVRALFHSRLC